MPALALVALVQPATACPLPDTPLQAGAVQADWRVAGGAAIAVGQHFAVEVQLCPAGATLARVNATMPEHRHGMNYRPSLQPLGGGRWRADGLMFHMAGRWELRLDVVQGGRTETLRTAITLP
jgi:hypothetical protein